MLNEPERDDFLAALRTAEGPLISPVNLWEARARVLTVLKDKGLRELARMMDEIGLVTAPITPKQADIAFDAHRRYGRGTRAKLNLGDCFAYALARSEDVPLLYKGDDFALTDVDSALA